MKHAIKFALIFILNLPFLSYAEESTKPDSINKLCKDGSYWDGYNCVAMAWWAIAGAMAQSDANSNLKTARDFSQDKMLKVQNTPFALIASEYELRSITTLPFNSNTTKHWANENAKNSLRGIQFQPGDRIVIVAEQQSNVQYRISYLRHITQEAEQEKNPTLKKEKTKKLIDFARSSLDAPFNILEKVSFDPNDVKSINSYIDNLTERGLRVAMVGIHSPNKQKYLAAKQMKRGKTYGGVAAFALVGLFLEAKTSFTADYLRSDDEKSEIARRRILEKHYDSRNYPCGEDCANIQ